MASWLETERGDVIVLHGICAIGRGDHNNIILNTSAVSRHHAVIHERDSEFWIVDLGGVNGIQINGRRVFQPVRLQPGDRILFPSALFVYKQGVLPVPVAPVPEQKAELPEAIAPAPEPVVELVDAREEPAPVAPGDDAGKKLRGRKKRRAAKKDKKLADGALLTQKLEVPREEPEVAIAQSSPKIVEAKIEPPKPFAFQLAPVIPVPEIKELSPAVKIKSTTVNLAKKKESPKPFAFQLTPVIPVPEFKELSPLVIITPALGEVNQNKGPLRPAVVRPATVSTWSGEKELPPTFFPVEPTVTFAKPKEIEFVPEAIPKLGPILIHPERIKELPLAPPPLPVAAPVEQFPEPAIALKPTPVIAPSVEKQVTAPVITSFPVAPKLEETKEAPPSIAAVSEAVPVVVMKDSPKESPVKSETKERVAPTKPLFIPTTRTLVLVNSNPPTMCMTAKRSMYIGLASIFLPFAGLVTAVMAIVLGHRALKLIRQSNGTLLGRDQAMTGLYFGYITLALIASYSTVFYFLYAPSISSTPSPFSAESPTTLTFDTTISIPGKPGTSASLAPASAAGQKVQSGTPMVLTPVHPSTSISSLSSAAPDTSTIPAMASTTLAASQPEVSNSSPADSASAQTIQSPEPTEKPSTAPDAAINSDVGKVATINPPLGAQLNSQDKSGPNPASSPSENGTAVTQPPPVFSFEQQERLKDEMLALPMPYENVDSTDYRDADAFNNSARILARQPESKYAESVQDFLDDVKVRNPDHIRLQILMAMYENYLAGLENGTSQ